VTLDHDVEEERDPPPSPWRWVVALALASLTLGAGWLVKRENERAARLKQVASEPAPPSPAPHTAPPATLAPSPAAPAAPTTSVPASKPRRSTAAPAPPPAPVAASGARLRITSDVSGAFVFLDRNYIGVTPLDTTAVGPGSYQLKVSAEGVGSVDQPLEVAASGSTEISVELRAVRLDASVDVIHKHALGSCEGRLIATPAGLRYATTRTSDGFTVALDGLETFEVDYLKKALRVKLRGGRTFNFTTDAPSADPLLVFHGKVEEARKKSRAGR
jgi:hypothetical protein